MCSFSNSPFRDILCNVCIIKCFYITGVSLNRLLSVLSYWPHSHAYQITHTEWLVWEEQTRHRSNGIPWGLLCEQILLERSSWLQDKHITYKVTTEDTEVPANDTLWITTSKPLEAHQTRPGVYSHCQTALQSQQWRTKIYKSMYFCRVRG